MVVLVVTLCLVLLPSGLVGQEKSAQAKEEDSAQEPRASKSGLRIPTFGGPNGVGGELEEEDRLKKYRFTMLYRGLKPWFDWKKEVHEKYGLSLGLNATLLGQVSSGSLSDRDEAGGGIYRVQGAWTAAGRGTGHPGTLSFRFEYRSRIGPLGPMSWSNDLGIATTNTGFPYSDEFGPDLPVLSWTQLFAQERAGFVVGRLDFAAYLDPYPYQTPARSFLNRAFVLSPTIATPGVGALGGGIKGNVSDQVWLGAMAYDANAASGELDFDTFDAGELFKHVEIGWTPAFERRKTDKIQLTYWEMDERPASGKTAGSGWLLTATGRIGQRHQAFLRAGTSDGGGGAPAEESVAVGMGTKFKDDELAFGASWNKPSEETFGPGLSDEYALELSYRLQMSPNSTLLPDVQLILDPAKNPETSSVTVWSLRVRWEI
jgi:porin